MFVDLNVKQRAAVTASCNGVLQIIAGPGTGKTKVLTSRVCHLLHEGIEPQKIIVTTFTKRAANEMRERLEAMIKGSNFSLDGLLVGTFHSICYRLIQKYGKLVGIEGYSIADERDSRQFLCEALEKIDLNFPPGDTKRFELENNAHRGFDVKKLTRQISTLKAQALSPEEYSLGAKRNPFIAALYAQYHSLLQLNKALDFDDCLLVCYQLISKHTVVSIDHILVDEFQDTNEVQLRLMYCFSKNVTIVGDPDQSIYAFRNAQSTNFGLMREHYIRQGVEVAQITLDENYRSTTDILDFSERLMTQQASRTAKHLKSQIPFSLKPIYSSFKLAEDEASWIAEQIGHLTKLPELLSHLNIAILVRSSYQTRVIESELTRRKIAYMVLRGKAFWERKEVVAILDYIRCVASDSDRTAFLRCVNFPKRGVGAKAQETLKENIERAQKEGGPSALDVMRRCKVAPKVREGVDSFLSIVDEARRVFERESRELFFDQLFKASGIQGEFSEEVALNIQEVKEQLISFQPEPDQEIVEPRDLLKYFVASVRLYDTDPSDEVVAKVALSTIHGSKGLEWPVVFVPGLCEGLLPASFAMEASDDAVSEERRCLYVATTRAKRLLFVSSYTETRGQFGRRPIEKTSRFLQPVEKMMSPLLKVTPDTVKQLYKAMGKPLPDADFSKLLELRKESRAFPGFQSAQGLHSAKRLCAHTAKFKAPRLSCASKPAKTAFKAPRLGCVTGAENEVKRAVSKAPPYVPVRTKLALGLRVNRK